MNLWPETLTQYCCKGRENLICDVKLHFSGILKDAIWFKYCRLTQSLLLPSSCQLANPDSVEGLVLVNIDTNARGWIDWAAQKVVLFSSFLANLKSSIERSVVTQLVLMRVLHHIQFSSRDEITWPCTWSLSSIDYVTVYDINLSTRWIILLISPSSSALWRPPSRSRSCPTCLARY